MKVRNMKIDMIKTIAIILVVYGHAIQYGSGHNVLVSATFFDDYIFKVIYSFHMPLFALVSGYLFDSSIKKRSWTDNLKHRFMMLVVPALIWSAVPFFQELSRMESVSMVLIIRKYIGIAFTNLWFLCSIWWCSLVVIFVNHFCEDKLWIYGIGWLTTFFIPDFFSSHLYKYMFPYFVIGYFCSKLDIIKRWRERISSNWMLFALGVSYCFSLYFYRYDSYIYTSGYYIFGEREPLIQILIDLYRLVIGLLGSGLVIVVVDRIVDKVPHKWYCHINFLGANTLGIYIISKYMSEYVLTFLTEGLSKIVYPYILLETVVILAVSIACIRLLQKNKYLSRILLGTYRREQG